MYIFRAYWKINYYMYVFMYAPNVATIKNKVFTYLLIFLLTYFFTYLLTYLHTYLLTYLLRHNSFGEMWSLFQQKPYIAFALTLT